MGVSLIGEALALRQWAMKVLGGEAADPPAVEGASWALFLRAERCALPLRARLGPGAPGSPLEDRFDSEIQYVLSVRAMLRRVERALGAVGTRGVALKGAVPLLEGGEPLDLRDLDVLVPAARVAEVGEALTADGLDVTRDAADNLPVHAPGGWERAVRSMVGSVPVELHVALPFVDAELDPGEVAPADGYEFMATPPPEVHLRHVLIHAVAHHPLRRGMLRELLLTAQAARACSEAERVSVLRWAREQPAADILLRALDAAAGLAAGEPDRFAAEAALRYLLLERGLNRAERTHSWLTFASCALLAGNGEYRRLWWGSAASAWGDGATHSFAGIRDPLKPLRFGWRGAHLLAVTPRAWTAARQARRASAGA